jgi:uncharacterized protein (TIGR02001 family)
MIRILLSAALLTAVAVPAFAQDAVTPRGDWSFSFGAATDNRSKEASKTDGEAFVWGQGAWESADGMFYGTVGAETIDGGGSKLESELALGVRPQAAGFDFDLNVAWKNRFDADAGYDADAWEFTADASRSIGPAGARVRLQHSPDGTGSTKAWTWYEARLSWDFTPKLSGSTAIGRREQDNSIDYTGWNVGLSYALTRNLEADLRWHATDADVPGEQYRDALVFELSASF